MRRLLLAIQPNHLDDAHLQQLVHGRDLVKHLQDVLDSLRHGALREEHERIPLARRVRLRGEEGLDEFGRVGNEMLEFTVDGVHCEDCVLAHVRVSVLKACAACRDERLEQFCVFRDLLEKSERCAANVLVRVLLYVAR